MARASACTVSPRRSSRSVERNETGYAHTSFIFCRRKFLPSGIGLGTAFHSLAPSRSRIYPTSATIHGEVGQARLRAGRGPHGTEENQISARRGGVSTGSDSRKRLLIPPSPRKRGEGVKGPASLKAAPECGAERSIPESDRFLKTCARPREWQKRRSS
jgi:hypothetical protein